MISRVVASMALALCCLLGGWGMRSVRASVGPSSITAAAGPAAASGADAAEDIRDIHGPIVVPGRRSVGWYVAGASVLCLATVGLVRYVRRRKASAAPHERALRALSDLRATPASDARTFSFAISEIVRAYVEEAFHVRAAHRTTEELLADLILDASPVAAHRTAVGEFLRRCDLAKFAGWSLSDLEMAALLESAETLVRATAPELTRRHVRIAALRGEGIA